MHHPRRYSPLRRRRALAPLAVALLSVAIAGATPPANAAPAIASAVQAAHPSRPLGVLLDAASTRAAQAATAWTATRFVGGDHLETSFGDVSYPDPGLTLDAVLAFAAAKTNAALAGKALTWLATPDVLAGYVGDGVGEAYAGATAKLALAVQVRHLDPTRFGGRDLIAQLRGLQAADGRFSDRSQWGDYSNAFTQSFAILALTRSKAGAPASSAAAFLARTRCADGGYPVAFGQATCTSDVDATAMVVQALRAAGRCADADRGVAWLLSVQARDGGFTNANSTGLAAQALADAGQPVAAARARMFLLGLQVRCAGTPSTRGAVAYDASGFDPATALRATQQAGLGLAGVGLRALDAAGSSAGATPLTCLAA